MSALASSNHPTYRRIIAMAWPVVVAGISTPLLGLVDTAVIGQTRDAAALGAIAIGSLALTFIYWAFGFLRMSTTGFVAQAEGAGDTVEVRAASFRAMALGGGLGVVICLLQWPIAQIMLPLLGADGAVRELSESYLLIRIWAAPATLVTYALTGVFIGLGQTKSLLALQLLLNGLNIMLDLWLAGWMDLGVRGIAIGTLVAEWIAMFWGLWLVHRMMRGRHADAQPFIPWMLMRQRDALRATMAANGNIMIRTLALLAGMSWVTRQGALLGETALAANHVLIAIISFCAFFMDGVAFSTESLVGAAKGRRDLAEFDRVVRRSTVLAAGVGITLGGLFWVGGATLIRLITDIPVVVAGSLAMLPFAATYIMISIGAFQLDGIFIGTTRTRDMRNASLLSSGLFIALSGLLTAHYGQAGLWSSMLVWSFLRGFTLACYYPRLRRAIS
jgi:multidrug resistance protein, MATE family